VLWAIGPGRLPAMVPIGAGWAGSGLAADYAPPSFELGPPACVILCGGLGTRLAGIAPTLPKAMVPVAGRPFLEWLIAGLRSEGVTRVVLATGYRADPIRDRFRDGAADGVEIRYSHEPLPLGTGGALRRTLPMLAGQDVLVVNGDTYTRIPVTAMLAMHRGRMAQATLLAVRAPERGRYGALEISGNGSVTSFLEKSAASGEGWISAGAYLMARPALERIPVDQPLSLETDVMPGLVGRGLYAVTSEAPFIDIGTPDSYREAASIVLGEASR
jgi:D-glycero-alpha-D-manno-heptose 1-phosphate guanylyltransferase